MTVSLSLTMDSKHIKIQQCDPTFVHTIWMWNLLKGCILKSHVLLDSNYNKKKKVQNNEQIFIFPIYRPLSKLSLSLSLYIIFPLAVLWDIAAQHGDVRVLNENWHDSDSSIHIPTCCVKTLTWCALGDVVQIILYLACLSKILICGI